MRTKQEFLETLNYHTPDDRTRDLYPQVNATFQEFGDKLWDLMPEGPSKTVACRKLRETRMAVNDCIANNGQ
jgi:hypothetical protein